jgi:hypothetical protein
MNIHFREPRHPGGFRFHTGTISAKSYVDQECYIEHPIEWWYGVSFSNRMFIGVIRTGGTISVREPSKMTKKAA